MSPRDARGVMMRNNVCYRVYNCFYDHEGHEDDEGKRIG